MAIYNLLINFYDSGLFGLNTLPLVADELVITEGEFDAMAVYQATGKYAISLVYYKYYKLTLFRYLYY